MSSSNLQHSKTQNLLLISKLLDGRESVSPFTLILDSLNQSARLLLAEFLIRAHYAATQTIFIAFESLHAPVEVDHIIRAHALDSSSLQKEISKRIAASPSSRSLIIIDTLHPLLSHPIHLPSYLTGLLAHPQPSTSSDSKASGNPTPSTSLIAVYHTDQPTPHSIPASSAYSPKPLTLLAHLATTVLTVHGASHVLARRAARNRSVAAPVFGPEESIEARGGQEAEGVLQGLGANDRHRIVVDGELRRRSGRAVGMCFVLDWSEQTGRKQKGHKADVYLLNDHPVFRANVASAAQTAGQESELGTVTFNLGLTEKQRQDREGVVLPYFDAQNESGVVGDGGRILYDMGVEDDFDEEEDEI